MPLGDGCDLPILRVHARQILAARDPAGLQREAWYATSTNVSICPFSQFCVCSSKHLRGAAFMLECEDGHMSPTLALSSDAHFQVCDL